MKTCNGSGAGAGGPCDYFRVVLNTGGGYCFLEPPKMFMIPIEAAPTMDKGGSLVPGKMTMAPASFYPSVRNTDGCSGWMPVNPSDPVIAGTKLS